MGLTEESFSRPAGFWEILNKIPDFCRRSSTMKKTAAFIPLLTGLTLTIMVFSTCATTGGTSAELAGAHAAGNAAQEGGLIHASTEEVQEITTPYAQLWSSDNITVKVGVPVRWYVEAAPDSLPKMGMACGKTIKIPGLGWGTDTYNDAEGHLTLVEGKNLVYEFTPSEVGDILFTCWMGSECHYNYIHVTANGAAGGTAGGAHISDASWPRGKGAAHNIVFRRH
jgi:hypothetical protein